MYHYCKTNFSTHKTKDLVSIHTQKYNEILNQMHESNAREKAELIHKLEQSQQTHTQIYTEPVEPSLTEMDLFQMQKEMEAFIQDD